jgi:hypothetical protein
VCRRQLTVGEEAWWNRDERTLTCLACVSVPPPGESEGQAGASAQREYDRRHARREQHARQKLGRLGVGLARITNEPQSTTAWKQGARGEVRTAERLAKHLHGHGVRLLHDRRVPGHGRANIDHIAIGPAGVLVIDSKTHRGDVRVDRGGGLFAPRRTMLLINGRDQTHLVECVRCQVAYVRQEIEDASIEVRGALCFPNPDGLPLFSRLVVREVVIDGPKPIAKIAKAPGPLDVDAVERLWRQLGTAFPAA